jgi:hypothetical protein
MTPEEQKALIQDYYKNPENFRLEFNMLIEYLKEEYPDVPLNVLKKWILEIAKEEFPDSSRRSLPIDDAPAKQVKYLIYEALM